MSKQNELIKMMLANREERLYKEALEDAENLIGELKCLEECLKSPEDIDSIIYKISDIAHSSNLYKDDLLGLRIQIGCYRNVVDPEDTESVVK